MKSGTSIIPPNVVSVLPMLKPSSVCLAVALGKFCNQEGICWPSTETLMRDAGISDWRTFKEARDELKNQCGLSWKSGRGRNTCMYQWCDLVTGKNTGTTSKIAPVENTDTTKSLETVAPVFPAPVSPVKNTGGTPHRTPHKYNNSVDEVFLTFSTKDGTLWDLTQRKIDEYRKTYPDLDVEAELRKAWQWTQDNPTKRKTANGMPRFLGSWLNRATNNGRSIKRDRENEEGYNIDDVQNAFDMKFRNPTPEELETVHDQ